MAGTLELVLLKEEEKVLLKIYSKLNDHLNRLKVEELAILSMIRKQENFVSTEVPTCVETASLSQKSSIDFSSDVNLEPLEDLANKNFIRSSSPMFGSDIEETFPSCTRAMGCYEEVVSIGKKLEKMVSSKTTDEGQGLDLLKSLKALPITLDILTKSRIGMTVNNFRKSSKNEEIGSLAKSLIKYWKKLLASDSNNKDTNNNSNSKSTPSPGSLKRSNSSSSAGREEDSQDSHRSSSPKSDLSNAMPGSSSSTTTTKFSNLPIKASSTTNVIRLKCREMLTSALESPDYDVNFSILAAAIEDCIYQEFNNTEMKYKNRVRSRVLNIRDSKNPQLKIDVLEGVIPPERIAVMTAEEMASEELKKLRARLTKESIDDHQMSSQTGTKSDLFKCGRCGQRDTMYNQVQTRSADEPMTTFVLCNHCGNRWKFC